MMRIACPKVSFGSLVRRTLEREVLQLIRSMEGSRDRFVVYTIPFMKVTSKFLYFPFRTLSLAIEDRLYSMAPVTRQAAKKASQANGNGVTSVATSPSKAKVVKGGSVVDYVVATRPWTFTASLMPMLLTAMLLHAKDPSLPLFTPRLFATISVGILVHAGSNLINTYFDFTR